MKKILLSLVLSSLLAPLTAHAAAIEISSIPTGGVGITNGSSDSRAVGTHTGVTGNFSDAWDISNPAGAFISVATSTNFSAFSVLYSIDNGQNYIPFSPVQSGSSYSVGPFQLNAFSANSPLKVIFNGATSLASSYNLIVATSAGVPSPSAVPVPAAVWLFGSALMGVASMSRRKKDVAYL